MKLSSIKKGFTLVEIMIVVVIIGLLAALAIPAFKKVRNSAIEKTIFNDAKQLTSGANQIFSENPGMVDAYFADLVGDKKFLQSLSSGNFVNPGRAATATFTNSALAVLTSGSYFTVSNANYNVDLSSNILIANTTYYTGGNKALCFQVDTGKLQSQLVAGATGQLN